MTTEWTRFAVSAGLIVLGLLCFSVGMVGVNSFKFVLNRMHAAGICDTIGTMLVLAGLMVAKGSDFLTLKLLLVLALPWISSPVSTHLLAMLESRTVDSLGQHLREEKEETQDGDI